MSQKISILHLEDRSTDAELIERELRKGGLNFDLTWVKDKEGYLQALSESSFDIILSDHSLPTLNSFGALQLMKEKSINVPFILITSNTTEEIAVAVMKAGACDYILKDRMQRLPSAVHSAIEKYQYEKEREEYLDKIIEYHDRYEIVSKATNDAIWDWDIKKDQIKWNQGIETIFGYTKEQLADNEQGWKQRIHSEDYDRVNLEMISAFAEQQHNWNSLYRYRSSDGSYKHVFDRAYILYESEKPIRMIGAMQDVTELTQYREGLEKMVEERTRELKEALRNEKELVEMKSKFISVASHEFRTPLTSISLAAGFIKKYIEKAPTEKLKEKLENIEQQVSHMAQLLDDVLLIGKSEAGKITTHITEVTIDFFEKIAHEIIQNDRQSHRLNYVLKSNQNTILTDEKLMRHIVINLLTNAVKFSPPATEVMMSVICTEKSLLLSVKDFGIGILPEEIKNLFKPFYRASNASAIDGTGLGLSIIKTAVDLLGGKIIVNSLPGHGTTFKIIVPLESELAQGAIDLNAKVKISRKEENGQ